MFVRTDVVPWQKNDDFRALKPHVSFKVDITPEELAVEHSIHPVAVSLAFNPVTEKLVERSLPVLDGGTYIGVAVVALTLEERKFVKYTAVVHNFMQKVAGGFSYEGHLYDIDDAAQANINAVQTSFLKGTVNAHGGYWRTYDDQNVAMSDIEAQAFFDAAYAFKMNLIRTAQSAKDAIAAATTLAEIDAVDVTLD
jgi:hypothetical protein